MPSFSMEVRKPVPGDAHLAQQIRAATGQYTTSHETLSARDASLERLVEQYRKTIDDPDGEGEQLSD